MRVRSLLQLSLIVLLAVGLTMCQQPSDQPAAPPATPEPPSAEEPQAAGVDAPEAVAEQVRTIQGHIRTARRRVRDGEKQEASLELSEVSSVCAQRALESTGEVKEHLEFSASEFSGLAERVFGSPAVTIDEMDVAITRAFWALAGYHFTRGSARWADGQVPETAAHLKASAVLIDESIGYLAGQREAESTALVAQMRDVARQLERGVSPGNANFTALIDDFGQKVKAYADHVRGRLTLLG